MARRKGFPAVLEPPTQRRHRTGSDAGAFSQSFGGLARGGRAQHLVPGRLETLAYRRQHGRFPRPGHPEDQVDLVPRGEQARSHFGLSLAETRPSFQLQVADGVNGYLPLGPGAGPLAEDVGQLGDVALVFDHTRRRPHRLPSAGHHGQCQGMVMGQDAFDCLVQELRRVGRAGGGRRPRPRRPG